MVSVQTDWVNILHSETWKIEEEEKMSVSKFFYHQLAIGWFNVLAIWMMQIITKKTESIFFFFCKKCLKRKFCKKWHFCKARLASLLLSSEGHFATKRKKKFCNSFHCKERWVFMEEQSSMKWYQKVTLWWFQVCSF